VFTAPSHAPIPSEEFDRAQLLAAEKEAIGLFISAHPLKEVGAALRAKVDCALSDLAGKRDGDWVTVGGMITAAKRIRTKKGDPMMFATLDDLTESVEVLIFGKALAGNEQTLTTDAIVLVRGRVDHKDRERICVVAQQVDPFAPTEEEVKRAEEEAAKIIVAPTALRLALDATILPATVLGDLKELLSGFPGESDVVVELRTTIGRRRLRLGRDFRVQRSAALHAELDALLGDAIVGRVTANSHPPGADAVAAGSVA
jgi:DNA polymerase-3 subunit alpha